MSASHHVIDPEERPRLGAGFDAVARAYDRERPVYPEELIDRVCAGAGLRAGARVLEIGCGTGQLTRALLARGLRVLAIDPAPNMVALARERARGAAFEVGRFEDVTVPDGAFDAVLSATAFHWVDPHVGWAKAAAALLPGGTLALLQYCTVRSPESDIHEQALVDALRRVAPELADRYPHARDEAAMAPAVHARRHNLSEAWAYLSRYPVAVPEAAGRFADVRLEAVAVERTWTADQLNALLETTSLSMRLGPERALRLREENRRAFAALGGTLRSRELAIALTGRAPR